MISFHFGELIEVEILFTDKHHDTYGTLEIADWQRAGLVKPSVIKPLIWPVLKTRVLGKLGSLARMDKDAVREMLAEILGSAI